MCGTTEFLMKNVRHNWIPKQNVRYNLIPNEKHAVQLDSQEKRTTRPRTGPPKKHTTRRTPGRPKITKKPDHSAAICCWFVGCRQTEQRPPAGAKP